MYEQAEVVQTLEQCAVVADYWHVELETAEQSRNKQSVEFCTARYAEAKADLEAQQYIYKLVFGS